MQELCLEAMKREEDFAGFMRLKVGSWTWPHGHSLERPTDEEQFLEPLSSSLSTAEAVAEVRDQFRTSTAAAEKSAALSRTLRRGIDALAERVFGLQP